MVSFSAATVSRQTCQLEYHHSARLRFGYMENLFENLLFEDLLFEILCRLSEKDLVKCKMVSKSWHRIISEIWARRFWAQSPVLGLYFYTMDWVASDFRHINYVSLYNYKYMEDLSLYKNDCMEDNKEKENTRFKASTSAFWHFKQRMQFFRHQRRYGDAYLDCCNGLLLLFKSRTYQLYVCNPITKEIVALPKVSAHHHDHFCAVLAFDPIESPHYRVARIDYSESISSTPLDIFSSESRQWVRHGLQLDPMFTEGFKSFELCRHFVYLHGALYSIASSWKLLCIDLNTVNSRAIELPDPEADKTCAMGCLGVSSDLLYYFKRDSSNTFRIWSYDDRCESGEWILRYSICCKRLRWQMYGYIDYDCGTTKCLEPYAISPHSDVLFFGTRNFIFSYHFESTKLKFVCQSDCDIATTGRFFTLRACFLPFYQLDKRNSGSTPLSVISEGAKILSAEVPCHEQEGGEQEDGYLYMAGFKCPSRHITRPFRYPSEMDLCVED